MEFNYKVTGERRKALVTTISELLDTKAVYKGMPPPHTQSTTSPLPRKAP